MLSQEDNELLTRTGPGTPAGNLLRRYWQPVALPEELGEDGSPLPLRVMGEDLALFRDEFGHLGLLGLRCPHRGTDLSYGRIEDGGLRCVYHGWLFDIHGNCLDQPGEPEWSRFADKVRHRSYPCIERGGLIFAYMGPGEPPELPDYECIGLPEENVLVTKFYHECNYLHGHEGNIDPQHLATLHYVLPETVADAGVRWDAKGIDVAPRIEVEETDYGIRIYSGRDLDGTHDYVRITNYVYPAAVAFPALRPPDITGAPIGTAVGVGFYGVNWQVPIDDTHHWKYMFLVSPNAPLAKDRIGPVILADMGPGYAHVRDRSNRYLQDRAEMKRTTYLGMGASFALQDKFAVEAQGDIQDRTVEHLGYADKPVALSRRLLLRAIREVEEGGEAPHIVRDPAQNRMEHLRVYEAVIPKTEDWRSIWQNDTATT